MSTTNDKEEGGQSPECLKDCELDPELGSNSPIIPEWDINFQFPIYVESMSGTAFRLDVFPSDTIHQIKQQLENTEGIPVCQQHIIWRYEELNNENTIEESSIGSGAKLRLVVDLTTGPVAGSPLVIDSTEDNEQNSSDKESRPLTILLFQNSDQIKVISITSNQTNSLDRNYFDSEYDLNKTFTNERSKSRQEEDKRMKNKINEIQTKLKSLQLKRKESNSNVKQEIMYSKESIKSEKLPHLDNNCLNSIPKEIKCDFESELHLPPISFESKFSVNSLNESTRLEKQNNFINQILVPSIDTKTVLYDRRHSLTLNNRISLVKKDVNRLDLLQTNSNNSISKLRPITAPAFNDVNDNHLINKLSRIKPISLLSKRQNSAKNNRSKSGRRLPPIVNNSKKKVNKIRCSFCRIKLGIVNRYKCRCGLVFCAKHRYSETHSCFHDYKKEGIESIRQNNPVVIPEKLPKI